MARFFDFVSKKEDTMDRVIFTYLFDSMTKKDYVIKVLESLKDTWPVAIGLLMLVQESDLSDEVINGIATMFMHATETVTDAVQQEKLLKSQDLLRKIQNMSDGDAWSDIDTMINDL